MASSPTMTKTTTLTEMCKWWRVQFIHKNFVLHTQKRKKNVFFLNLKITCFWQQQLDRVAFDFWTNCQLVSVSNPSPEPIHAFSLDLDTDPAGTIHATGYVFAPWNNASSVHHPKWCVATGTSCVHDIYQLDLEQQNLTNLQFSIGCVWTMCFLLPNGRPRNFSASW